MSENKIVQEWFRISQNDLISARHLYNDIYPKQKVYGFIISKVWKTEDEIKVVEEK